jgi:GDP-mannose 6-dehydrogenase
LRISLFGLGYVGSVSAACLARDGHTVLVVDVNAEKLAALDQGRSPIIETGLEDLIRTGAVSGRLRSQSVAATAVATTDVSIVCVGTPSAPDGGLDTTVVEQVAAEIGRSIATKPDLHTIIVRSTLPPGAMTARIKPAIERASGLTAGVGFALAYHPEFMREGLAISDYDQPTAAVVAVTDDHALECVKALQPAGLHPLSVVNFAEAEAIKIVKNVWHASKVSFGNEIGLVLGALGIDSHQVMDIVRSDRRPNMAGAYLMPGFAFGGSCLPKDLAAFAALGRSVVQSTPMVAATSQVNHDMIEKAAALIEAAGPRVSLIGLSFKEGTDDLRESPFVMLAERLLHRGCDLRIYDPGVRLDVLTGANLKSIHERLPTLDRLMCSTLDSAVEHAAVLALAHPGPGTEAIDRAGNWRRIVDLVRVRPNLCTSGNYYGLSW